MARLIIKKDGAEDQVVELKLGTNRLGRTPTNDFQIQHPTISGVHCEIQLTDTGVTVRDLESTNGTFIDDRPVREARIEAGAVLRLGDVELFVENTDANVAIPKFANFDLPAPPIVTAKGGMLCPRHSDAPASFQCSQCKEVMCDGCVHRIRRKGGKTTLLLCPICGGVVNLIGAPVKQKKKSWLARTAETVRLKLTRGIRLDH
jgi:pSer/pThr/pTyr-binding forkhead associated (FHA) protein